MPDTTHEPFKHYVDARSPGWVKHIIEDLPEDHEVVQLVNSLREAYELKNGWKLSIESRKENHVTIRYWHRDKPTYFEYVIE